MKFLKFCCKVSDCLLVLCPVFLPELPVLHIPDSKSNFHSFVTICQYVIQICEQVDRIEEEARVAEIVPDMWISDEVSEAKDMIKEYDCHCFVKDLTTVMRTVFQRLYNTDENHLEDRSHHEDEKLPYKYPAKHDHGKCK